MIATPQDNADELRDTVINLWPTHICNEMCKIEEFYRSYRTGKPHKHFRCIEHRKEQDTIIAFIQAREREAAPSG